MLDPRLERLKKKAQQVVKNFSSEHAASHADFVRQSWPTSALRKDPTYLAWKFRSNSPAEIHNLLLAIHENNVVGQLGVIPAQIKIDDQVLSAGWGCNFKVLEAYEGAGYGSLLDIQSLSMNEVTLGASPTKQSEELKIRLNFLKLEGPVKMAYPISFLPFIEMKLGSLPMPLKKLMAGLAQLAFRFVGVFKHGSSDKELVKTGTYQDIIAFIKTYRASITLPHIVHDETFLNWRCGRVGDHRTESMSLYLADGSFILYYPSKTYCYLYESSFKSGNSMKLLLNELVRIARQKNCTGLYTYVNYAEQQTQLKSYGFFSFRERVTVYAHSGNPSIKFGNKFHLDAYDSDGNI
jgi:hypothetical protein